MVATRANSSDYVNLSEDGIRFCRGFEDEDRRRAAKIYDAAFGDKFALAVPSASRRVELLASTWRPDCCFTAFDGESLVGIAGFHSSEGALTEGITATSLIQQLGYVGGLRAMAVFSFYERKRNFGQLVMEGIAVASSHRGRRIGSRLLQEVITYAQNLGEQSIRLDVIDTNDGARRLYERHGFVPVKSESFEWLRWLLGFGGVTTMERTLTRANAG